MKTHSRGWKMIIKWRLVGTKKTMNPMNTRQNTRIIENADKGYNRVISRNNLRLQVSLRLSHTISIICLRRVVHTVAFTTTRPSFSARRKDVTSGSAMAREPTSLGVTFSGTWSRPTTRRWSCILSQSLRSLHWNAIFVGRTTCFSLASSQQRPNGASFFSAESHVWVKYNKKIATLTRAIGNLSSKTRQFNNGL